MHCDSLINLCNRAGFPAAAEVKDYEARGLIRSTAKGANRFYSLRETYQCEGDHLFYGTHGLTAEKAAVKVDDRNNHSRPEIDHQRAIPNIQCKAFELAEQLKMLGARSIL